MPVTQANYYEAPGPSPSRPWPAGSVLALILLCACPGSTKKLPVFAGVHGDAPAAENAVQVRFLGAGGFLIRRGGDALLLDPFFSNPGLLRVGLLPLKTRADVVDRFMPKAADVQAILIGHAHYDHLMDVPYVRQYHTPAAKIYGSRTTSHILAPRVPASARVVLDRPAVGTRPGEWIPIAGGRIRFMAIVSEHAPHVGSIKFFSGKRNKDRLKPPKYACHWPEGQTLAYLIDFLDEDGNIGFRIHYQDSASNPPLGFPPDLPPGEQKTVDLAILCVASFHNVRNYPEDIIDQLQPRNLILGHWEDFFRPYRKAPKTVRLTKVDRFIQRMQTVLPRETRWYLPQPGALMVFED